MSVAGIKKSNIMRAAASAAKDIKIDSVEITEALDDLMMSASAIGVPLSVDQIYKELLRRGCFVFLEELVEYMNNAIENGYLRFHRGIFTEGYIDVEAYNSQW